MEKTEKIEKVARDFDENRSRLLRIANIKMSDLLQKRISPDDLLQETYIAIVKRIDYFCSDDEIPVFIRFRTMLLQTLTDMQRKHLGAKKRDVYCELEFDAEPVVGNTVTVNKWNFLANTVTSPRTKIAKQEQYALIHEILKNISEADQEIIQMRNFEDLSNLECAKILNIEPKASSIRYIRALKRFKEVLIEFTEFRP